MFDYLYPPAFNIKPGLFLGLKQSLDSQPQHQDHSEINNHDNDLDPLVESAEQPVLDPRLLLNQVKVVVDLDDQDGQCVERDHGGHPAEPQLFPL